PATSDTRNHFPSSQIQEKPRYFRYLERRSQATLHGPFRCLKTLLNPDVGRVPPIVAASLQGHVPRTPFESTSGVYERPLLFVIPNQIRVARQSESLAKDANDLPQSALRVNLRFEEHGLRYQASHRQNQKPLNGGD